MVPRKHPLAQRSWVRLTDCAAYDLVLPDTSLALRATLDQMFARVDMKPRAVLTTNSYELMRSAASAGVGIAILTQYLFGRDPNHPTQPSCRSATRASSRKCWCAARAPGAIFRWPVFR